MIVPYKLKRQKDRHGYTWTLVDISTDHVIHVGHGVNPAKAPEFLRRTQARLNSRYVLDKILVRP